MIQYKLANQNNLILNKFSRRNFDYSDDVLCLDIETTSLFKINNKWDVFDYDTSEDSLKGVESYGLCYLWQFGINETVYYGRTLEELKEFLEYLYSKNKCKLLIYIHNSSFEIQFLRNIWDDMTVFARKERKPIYFTCFNNMLEFRCSYLLSNMSLSNLGENYNKKYFKLDGGLDYDAKIRTPYSKLSETELKYSELDILVMYEYLTQMKNQYGCIKDIPLTQTGKVRRDLRCHYQLENKYFYCKFRNLIPNFDEYIMLHTTFTGAITHLNPLYFNRIMKNVHSIDFASSYPYVLLTEKYPISKFRKLNISKISTLLGFERMNNVWIAKIRFSKIKSKTFLNTISYSKCIIGKNFKNDNGKVYSADYLELYVTNIDFKYINMTYNYESIEIIESWVAKADYLDDVLRNYILMLFQNKTSLKGVNESLYMNSKEKINALYGMQVTNVINDIIEMKDNTWCCESLTSEIVEKQLNEQKKSFSICTNYSVGVFCTSYARYNLISNFIKIGEMGHDAIYSDTDSIKYVGDYDDVIEDYNKSVIEKLEKNCKHLDYSYIAYTPKGQKKIIGIFEKEDDMKYFCSVGAKKYWYQTYDDKMHITIAGLNGKKVVENGIVKKMTDMHLGKKFDYRNSGRTVAFYNDEQKPIIIDGIEYNYKYGIAIRPTTYTLDTSKEYDDFIYSTKIEYSNNL